jgi:hypothetical protein
MGISSDELITALGCNLFNANSFVSQEADELLARLAEHSQQAFATLFRKGLCGPVSRDDRYNFKRQLVEIARTNPQFIYFCANTSDERERQWSLIIMQEAGVQIPESSQPNNGVAH